MKLHNINNYFFLDQSFPFLMKTINSGVKKVALRLSEYESIDMTTSSQELACVAGGCEIV